MSELLDDFFLLGVNNRIDVTILVVIMVFILFLIIILTIIKKNKNK